MELSVKSSKIIKIKMNMCGLLIPLDGTHSFISGKPLFGTLICCLKNQKPILGLIDIPIMNQRWHGAKGFGIQFNNKKCKLQNYQKNLIS